MSVFRRSRRNRLSYILLVILSLLILFAAVFCYQLSIHIDEISRYESRLLAVRIINSAVDEVLAGIDVNDIITESRDNNGQVTSLTLDHTKTNRINNTVSSRVTELLKQYEDEGFKVPIGTLSGITFLNGRGFDIDLRLHQLGAVSTQILSDFVSEGINQTKYRVYIRIKVELSTVLPLGSTDVSVDHEYVIGEKVVVGTVPNTFFSA